jgi:two-component system NarL family response regulator
MNARIRVLCVDDHAIVRDGVALVLGREHDCEVIATAASAPEAIALFRVHRPDITLMDLRLPGMGGLEAIRTIKAEFPNAKIIVLTVYDGDEDVFSAMKAGAATYLLKDTLSADLVRAIRQVHTGHVPMNADVAERLNSRALRTPLSHREIQVLGLLADGMRNKEISDALGISEETVRVHVKNLMAKLKVSDRTAAVTVAARHGIIHLDQPPR